MDSHNQNSTSDLIPPHGGYRKLKSFQIAQLVYDVTVRFCGSYIDRRSRTHDQMVQAAWSGVQNIAEGSQASGTSKKTELKLTNVARASLEELRLDYEDFLRQRGLPLWKPDYPALVRFKAKRCSSLEDVRDWIEEERGRGNTDEHGLTRADTDKQKQGNTDKQGQTRTYTDRAGKNPLSVPVSDGQWVSVQSSVLAANAALSLLNLCCYLLDRQLEAQAKSFEQEGGFTERLYKKRTQAKKTQ
jgi:four helix bundle suffix protein